MTNLQTLSLFCGWLFVLIATVPQETRGFCIPGLPLRETVAAASLVVRLKITSRWEEKMCGYEDAPAVVSVVEVFKGNLSSFVMDTTNIDNNLQIEGNSSNEELIMYYTTDKGVRGERGFPVPIRRDDEGFLAFPAVLGACATNESTPTIVDASNVLMISECNYFNIEWSGVTDEEREFLRTTEDESEDISLSNLQSVFINGDEDNNGDTNGESENGQHYATAATTNVTSLDDSSSEDTNGEDVSIETVGEAISSSSSRTGIIVLQSISACIVVFVGLSSSSIMW